MLVKAFTDYKTGKGLEGGGAEIKALNDLFSKRKIPHFQDFLDDTITYKDEEIYEMGNMKSRGEYIKEDRAHTQKVLQDLNTDDLPQAEGFEGKTSQVGSYISADKIVELYGDEFEGILKDLGKEGMLVYCWGNETTWWKRKSNGGDDDGGLVRVE